MRIIRRWVCLFVSIFLIYILASYYFWRVQIGLDEAKKDDFDVNFKLIENNKLYRKFDVDVKDLVTVIIREFEEFENDLTKTVETISDMVRGIQVLIIADKLPYPPLNVEKLSHVKIINLKPPPNTDPADMKPEYNVHTPFVLLVPDGIRLINSAKLKNMIMMNQVCSSCIVVARASGLPSSCQRMSVSLRNWTIQSFQPQRPSFCNVFDGSQVILMPSMLLFNMSYPFARPFPYALFIQAALNQLKVEYTEKLDVFQAKSISSNPHLQWKKKNFHAQRLFALYRKFGIKKVVDPAGVEWFGCTKQTPRCFGTVVDDVPEYLYEGRNTPPCCMEALKQTGKHVMQSLQKSGVRYWLEGGSLLGAARHADIIPWDYDIDIGIYRDDINKSQALMTASSQAHVDEEGFVWERAREGDFFRVQYSKSNHMHVDIFPFVSRGGTMTKSHWFKTHPQDREFPEHFLRPLTTIHFIGMKASAPNNIRDFLELKFGEGAIENPKYPSSLRYLNVTML